VEREYLPKERRKELRAMKVSRPASANFANRPVAAPIAPASASTESSAIAAAPVP
jgi:hypothetical protein